MAEQWMQQSEWGISDTQRDSLGTLILHVGMFFTYTFSLIYIFELKKDITDTEAYSESNRRDNDAFGSGSC